MKVLVMQHESGDRYRTVQYFKSLEKKGYTFSNPHFHLKKQWPYWLQEAQQHDIVWIARRLLPFHKLAWLKRVNENIVFDFDDALWLRSSRKGAEEAMSKRIKFSFMLDSAKQVVAGNDFLKRQAALMTTNSKLTVIPSVINENWYAQRSYKENGVLVLGWIGSRSTLSYLQRLRPVFEAFNELHIPWKLKVVSDVFPHWPHLPLEKKQWKLEDEKKDLQDMDIGLNPLTDDDWCRGKCALKAIQNMSVGSLVLGSPVGVNKQLIKDGQNGFLCETFEQWFCALEKLAKDFALIERLGKRAYQTAMSTYTMEKQVDQLEHVFEKATQ